MNAPNRAAEAAIIVNDHRDLFGSDDRRRGILYYVCRGLNALDDGRWGIVVQADRGDFIPEDVICDKLTREHVGLLGDDRDRAVWINYGVLPKPAWYWAPADLVKPAEKAAPDEPPAPPSPPTPEWPPGTVPGPFDHDALVVRYLEDFARLVDSVEQIARAAMAIDGHLKNGAHVTVKWNL